MRTAGIVLLFTALLSWFFQAQGWRVPVFKVFDLLNPDDPITWSRGVILGAGGLLAGLALTRFRRLALAGWITLEITALLALLSLVGWNPLASLWNQAAPVSFPATAPGHALRVIAIGAALWMIFRPAAPVNPLTLKRWRRFKSIRRGYVSFLILIALTGVALLDNAIVGKQALAVRHQGKWTFPFLLANPVPGAAFGLDYDSETDYRELKRAFALTGSDDIVILPLIPYSARLDTPPQSRPISRNADGLLWDNQKNRPFTGTAFTVYKDKPGVHRREYRVRDGVFHGTASGYDDTGGLIERIEFSNGKPTQGVFEPDPRESEEFRQVLYPPVAPVWSERHFLGTDSSGTDIVALLFAGFQLQWGAAFFYALFVFALGIGIGSLTGYLGGWTDLGGQRLIEIWSALPLIFVVILIRSTLIPGIVTLVLVLAALSWMGMTYTIRGAVYAEKARDYVAAARLLGAGDGRVIFLHILPNIVSIVISKLPFTIEALIGLLTALDFLGFGLPPGEPSWGALLRDGTDNMNSWWILYSAFAAIVVLLTLITFVGEAVREAFDPKKFTVYR